MFEKRLLRYVDWWLLGAAGVLSCLGVVMICSCTFQARADAGMNPFGKAELQVLWFVVGLVALCAMALPDYTRFMSFRHGIYVTMVVLLVLVVVVGRILHGAQRWLAIGPLHLQPSELAQVGLTITLAALLARREEQRASATTLGLSLVHALPVAALIFLERDLGTPLIILGIWLVVMFASGARIEQLAVVVLVVLIGFGLMWGLDVINDYQKRRLVAFANPGSDPRGAGYHLQQAKTAVGSGGIVGCGLFEGTHSKLGFIPEQSTDFIFTVVGEETGFVGSTLLLILYGFLLHRCLLVAEQAKDTFGRLIAVGIGAMFFIHIFVNIGMTLGLMPVKGLPLPFFSYGGSNMLASMAAIGLLQNIHIRRHKIAF